MSLFPGKTPYPDPTQWEELSVQIAEKSPLFCKPVLSNSAATSRVTTDIYALIKITEN